MRHRVVATKRLIRRLLHRCGTALIDAERFRVVPRSIFDDHLSQLLREPDFFFIQIGAHDGVRFDGLYNKVTTVNAHGIVVEPIPRYFARLATNYEDYPGVLPLNVALHPALDQVEIHHVDPQRAAALPPWVHGIGSVDGQHHRRSHTLTDCITRTVVDAISFTTLLDRYDVRRIDLLQIDVEGFDHELLATFPFGRVRPRLIKFEITAMAEHDRTRTIALLEHHGYRTHDEGEDGIAILGTTQGVR